MAITINGDGTLTGVSVGGLPDGIVDADMLATSAVATAKIADDAVSAAKLGTNTFVSYAVICDQKTQDTDAGAFTSGAWRTRDLNTEILDPDSIVTISSNQFTLANAGTYLIEWSAPAMRVGAHRARLYDVTGTAAVQVGSNEQSSATNGDITRSFGEARVTITASNTYRIEHRTEDGTSSVWGFGYRSNLDVEIYTVVKIYKEA